MAGGLNHGRQRIADFLVVVKDIDDRLRCFIHPHLSLMFYLAARSVLARRKQGIYANTCASLPLVRQRS
jgi:hypothetical protein